MKIIVVWLLISVSDGSYNKGTVTVVERFPTAETCEFVRTNIPARTTDGHRARCIQATIVKP